MPLYVIRRDVGTITKGDLDAASFRSIVCGYEFPTMTWLRSYWDEAAGIITCYYVADSVDDVREHARRARVPCDDVREVMEFGPNDYAHLAAVARNG
jgi:hypothetical protein